LTIYDVHAHCVPLGLLDELRRDRTTYGAEVLDDGSRPRIRFAGGLTTRPVRADLMTVESRLVAMDEARVDVQILSSWIDLTGYGLPGDVAIRYARMFNDALAGTVAEHSDRFLGLCNVPLQDPAAAAKELVRAVTDDGFVGAEIATSVEDLPLGDPGLDPFWAAAAELRCPILIHPSYVPTAGGHLDLIENVVGRPAASTTAMAHMVFGGVLARFPELRLVLVHGGGFVPWQVARWDQGIRGAAKQSTACLPSEQLGNVYHDAVLFDPRVVGYLIDWAGAKRVVLGSDYPFPSGDLMPVDTLDAVVGLTDEQRHAIEGGNVERLLAGIRR
jgi:aminocarboxymuconate-semialdehyde decarboxylase